MEEEIAEIMAEVIIDGQRMFESAVAQKKLILTSDLKNSFESNVIKMAEGIAGEITFRGYGRLKDMKSLRYFENMPPVEAIEYYIEKIGIENFGWVPGYKDKKASSLADINRIAWAIAKSKKQAVNVTRGYRGTWYNDTKINMINIAKKKLRDSISKLISKNIAQSLSQLV